ncbi:hypothetical protein BG015_008327 [Linnemannia schmuckeri]|uniref:Peptidase metallopeptidase domain-containing protein n=1 Tax=Linnemannia schmuckeri TaxID=64567 RepID=A0A9P5VF30_9FUNG|nr:hypothetical protein BG015_008327 [Linnemannia schmuckeri]
MKHIEQDLPKADPSTHRFGKHRLCVTGERAHKLSPLELRGGTRGFIPVWEKDVVLRYRFNDRSLRESKRTKKEILNLFNKAVEQWGDAAPVKFIEDEVVWDFEFDVRKDRFCFEDGCVLASAFFPDGGRHHFVIYPSMFDQSEPEQVETLVHELGHVFGLRHWFAKYEDAELGGDWRSEVFGHNDPVTIMNYDDLTTDIDECTLTKNDKHDLKHFYNLVWNRDLVSINKTPIRLFKPFSAGAPMP